MYRIPPETLLRRVSYHGTLPFACPLAHLAGRRVRTGVFVVKARQLWRAF